MKASLLSVFSLIFLLSQIVAAEKVLYVNLIVHDTDSVDEKYVIVTEGRQTRYYQKPGHYTLKVLDTTRNTVWNQSFDVSFSHGDLVLGGQTKSSDDPYENRSLSYKIPYEKGMETLILLHGNKTIFSKTITYCNQNGICDGTETHYSCPFDCPLTQGDHICTKDADGACDPDCAPGVDLDCSVNAGAGIPGYFVYPLLLLVLLVVSFLVYRKRHYDKNMREIKELIKVRAEEEKLKGP
jgi:hypothetical protein